MLTLLEETLEQCLGKWKADVNHLEQRTCPKAADFSLDKLQDTLE